MDAKLISRLIGPVTVVALATIFAVDLHLTRKARIEAMRIVAAADSDEAPSE